MRNWTEDQKKVIETAGSSMLVSAAAGSGKTAVLVERIIRKITGEQRADIDRLLVVTFTNAAAGEMRERIRAALEAALEERPDDEHLVRQLTLVHNAKIMTIHSFCLDVIRNHFHEISIDPAFRVADEGEIKLLRADVMTKIMEEEYATGGMRFMRFVDAFTRGTTDENAQGYISQFYDFSISDPWPEKWRHDCLKAFAPMSEEELENCDWIRKMVADAVIRLDELKTISEKTLALALEADGPSQYEDVLRSDAEAISAAAACTSYSQMQRVLADFTFKRLPTTKNPAESPDKKDRVQKMRNGVKAMVQKLSSDFFAKTAAEIISENVAIRELAEEMVRLSDKFAANFSEAKKERNIVDFNDLEHMALNILVQVEDGKTVPTETAREYAAGFDEIMTDEYQDSNLVQEILLESVAGGKDGIHNRFMVGDVKQSIYRFRQARPQLFLEKYNRFSKEEGPERRIDLHMNFRSRAQVLGSVNRIFERVMIEQVGGIIYDEDARLNTGAAYPDGDEEFLKTEITVLSGEENKNEKANAEAAWVAARIKEMLRDNQVWDADAQAYRGIRFGDIVILLRSMKEADYFVQTMSDAGIPVYTGSGSGYFSTLEVRTVLAYLSVIDNPRQDIPLSAALRSPIGMCTDDELARIRCVNREADFYTAALTYMEQQEDLTALKLRRFFETAGAFRDMAPSLPISELIWRILSRTGYGDFVRAMPAGAQRKANLDMLIEKAMTFEQGAFRGLFNFIRYIENLKTYEIDYGEAPLTGGGADAVRIMTIHKSKGLEFPIVFLCSAGKQFNKQDDKSALALHAELGIAFDRIDPIAQTKIPGMMKQVFKSVNKNESYGEEMRVLYVALTRAKEKLIITGYAKDREKAEEKWLEGAADDDGTLSYLTVDGAACFLDWIMPAVLSGDNASFFKIQYPDPEKEEKEEGETVSELSLPEAERTYDEKVAQTFARLREDAYPYASSRQVPGKMSVSELKIMGHETDEDAHELFPAVRVIRPAFAGGEEVGGAARGTIYHRVLECFDYSVPFEGGFVAAQLETMADCGKIAKDDAQLINPDRIEGFMRSELGGRMKKAWENGCLHREAPFVIGVAADTVKPEWPSCETVLVQGIIDAWFEEDGEIVIVDYKSDLVPQGEGGAYLARKYGVQLAYYSSALEKLTGKKVKERLIYSLRLGETIPV